MQIESNTNQIISGGSLNDPSTSFLACKVNRTVIPNKTVCKSCKLVGHTRTTHRDCLHNKDHLENQNPVLINTNLIFFNKPGVYTNILEIIEIIAGSNMGNRVLLSRILLSRI